MEKLKNKNIKKLKMQEWKKKNNEIKWNETKKTKIKTKNGYQ
jgi:hypothetical protein